MWEEWFVHLSLCWHALHVTLDNSHHLLGIWLHIYRAKVQDESVSRNLPNLYKKDLN